MIAAPFDFHAFQAAVEGKDLDSWASFYADDAEWTEYRNQDPPSRPVRRTGIAEIRGYLESMVRSGLERTIGAEVIGKSRIAFRCWTILASDRKIVEHTILDIGNGKIVKQVDVEAWDLQTPDEWQ